ALHRGWLNVKSAITGKDEAAVLAECERGEDVALQHYQDALREDLPSDVRNLIERQYQGVMANHELVRGLRDRARTQT
ncbi:MAG: PA2169 family four-helix-bundle protein, partial [bacterium]